jgi:hypothetical protein
VLICWIFANFDSKKLRTEKKNVCTATSESKRRHVEVRVLHERESGGRFGRRAQDEFGAKGHAQNARVGLGRYQTHERWQYVVTSNAGEKRKERKKKSKEKKNRFFCVPREQKKKKKKKKKQNFQIFQLLTYFVYFIFIFIF